MIVARPRRAGLPAACGLGVLLVAGTTFAQQAHDTGIPADRFVPAPGATAFLGVDGAGHPPGITAHAALSLAAGLVAVDHRFTGERVTRPVERTLTLDLGLEVRLARRLALGVGLPVAVLHHGDRLASLGDAEPLAAATTGDIRLRLRLHALGAPTSPLQLDVVLLGTVPTGGNAHFFASAAATVELRAALTYRLPFLRLGALAGARVVPVEQQLLDYRDGSDAHLALAADAFLPRGDLLGRVHLLVEAEALPRSRYLELRAGLRALLPLGFAIDLGGGAGLLDAPTNPAARAFVIVRYAP